MFHAIYIVQMFKVAAIAVGVISCVVGISGCTVTIASKHQSNTPRITGGSGAANAALNSKLLQSADLAGMAGLPAGIQLTSIDQANLHENPDPRGPCGAKISSFDAGAGALVGITGPAETGSEEVFDTPTVSAFVKESLADLHPGCASYTSTTNTGGTQRVTLLHSASSTTSEQTKIEVIAKIDISVGTVYGNEVLLSSGRYTGVFSIFTSAPLSMQTLDGLAATMSARIGS